MRKKSVTGKIEWHDLELDFEGEYTFGIPGVYSGPPERCYPSEPGEIELTSLKLGEVDVMCLIQTDHGDDICQLALECAEEDLRDD